MERVSWIQNGSNYRRVEGNIDNVDIIPKGIYSVNFNPLTGWSLDLTAEKFVFNYKIYGLQKDFIDHVLKTYYNTSGNFGVLLNGIRGTGKTVSAKMLANAVELPVIIVKSFGENNTALIEYLSSFNFDCVFFFDEFEKTWDEKDCSILQIMDGAYNSDYRRLFLLTTNVTSINENLLSRPSRIRYVKEFGNLEEEVVREYLKDNLHNQEIIDNVVDIIDTLEISTIDILKTIVEDINIHGLDVFNEHREIFNIKTATYHYDTLATCITDPNTYPIEQFIREIKIKETLKQPYKYEFDTEDEYQTAYRAYAREVSRIKSIDTRYVETNKSCRLIKLDDKFGYYNSEIVVHADIANRVIITKDTDEVAQYWYYYIKDINVKPSLYSARYTPYVF